MKTLVTLEQNELVVAVEEYVKNHMSAGYKSELKFDEYNFQTTTTGKAFVDISISIEDIDNREEK